LYGINEGGGGTGDAACVELIGAGCTGIVAGGGQDDKADEEDYIIFHFEWIIKYNTQL
jgi:hypothetical protein